jgi:hypothetical protein
MGSCILPIHWNSFVLKFLSLGHFSVLGCFISFVTCIWSWFWCCYLWPWNLISWNVASLFCISWTWVVEEIWPLLFGCWNQNVSPMIPIIKHWLKFNQFLLCGSCFTLWSRWKTKHGILCVKSYLLGHWQWQTYSHMKW